MKVLYVTTISNTINAFLIPHIRMLIDSGYEVDIACNLNQPIDQEIFDLGVKFFSIQFERSPLSKDNILAYKQLKEIVSNYDIVHTHTPVASMIVRLACRKNINIRVIYTAHGFHFFKGSPTRNWLLYYPVEKCLSRFTDLLITINKEDYYRTSKFQSKKVSYIPGVGIDTNKINEIEIDKGSKRKELGIPLDAFVVLSVGELNDNKNHQAAIKALALLDVPDIHYIICGKGNKKEYLINLSERLNIEKRIHFLGYRNDIIEICKVSDIFMFPSKREGLPVSVMEAMASGLPIIGSKIRGITDLIEEGNGGYLINPSDIEAIKMAIETLYYDESIREQFSKANKERSIDYSVEQVLKKLKELMIN